MVLFLTRQYFPEGTNGKLQCAGKQLCHTIELPWRQNEERVSCIPEGEYVVKKRYSNRFKWHLEVRDVKGRSMILIHPANNALLELKGCIAPVTKISGAGLGLQSRKAFSSLKEQLYRVLEKGEPVLLVITS